MMFRQMIRSKVNPIRAHYMKITNPMSKQFIRNFSTKVGPIKANMKIVKHTINLKDQLSAMEDKISMMEDKINALNEALNDSADKQETHMVLIVLCMMGTMISAIH